MVHERSAAESALLASSFDWARSGDVHRLTELLDWGCPVDLTNDHGDTWLILAAYHQQAAVVGLLLDRGAAIDRSNDNGQTALGSAAFRQDAELVGQLLRAGADPDAGARSARQVVAFFDLPEMAELLNRPAH